MIITLREVVEKAPIDILCIDETKLDDTFPDAQFKIDNYQYPPFVEIEMQREVEKLFM